MSENVPESKPRTVEDVQREFTQLCAKAGHIQYQISCLTKDLGLVNTQCEELSIEAAKISRAEAESKENKNV